MSNNSSNLRCILPVVMLWSISPLRLLADDPQNEFRDTIQPILTGKCLTCHSADKKKGKLDLSRRAPAIAGGESGKSIEPGKPEESILFQKISAGEMPPRNPLSAEQVEAFKKWIAAGAPYEGEPLIATVKRAGPGWWSLQKIRRPLVPRTNNPHWIRTPIDAFILARLEAQGLTPAPEADRTTLIRRAYFDLLGLPPALEAVDRFVHDTDPKAYEKLIDELLASQHYGERWARHWLDIVRFAESHGYEMNTLRPNAWPYRDYVIRAFNNDTPYPQFILEQLAGDILKNADWLTQSATGFLVGGAHDMVGNQTPDGMLQQRMDDLDDIISATSATFLGLTVNCCRCHDHKFDPLTQRDYYGMQAILAGVQHADREMPLLDTPERRKEIAGLLAELSRIDGRLDDLEPLCQPTVSKPARLPVNSRRNVERFAPVDARFVRFTISATNTGIEPCIDELEIYTAGPAPRNVALAATGAKATASSVYPNNPIHRLEHLTDGQYGNSRSWISNEIGKGWVQIEFPEVMKIDRIIWGRDREEKFKDRLATNYRIEVALEPGKWQLVASSADRLPITDGSLPASRAELSLNSQRERVALLASRTRIQEKLASLQSKLQVYAGTFSQPGQTHVLLRGDPMQKGEPASPGALAIVQPPFAIDAKASESERRRALARWLGHPDNPLPARVLVNRVWHYHFGQGIVNTPSDFGYNGDRPSHPELLDWLASEFVTNGWHLKPLHRMIMLSSTYRQSVQPNAKAMNLDRQNRLLWRMAPRRLEAEAVRDAILAVSGKLDPRIGGPGYNIWEKNTNYVVVFKPKTELGPEEFRRMIYQFKPRSQQDPTFGILDCPDGGLAKPRRTVSTTALQALNLLNGSFTMSQSEFFARRLIQEAGADVGSQVALAFQLAFGRAPTSSELATARELIGAHGLPAFCRAMYNANEFLYVD